MDKEFRNYVENAFQMHKDKSAVMSLLRSQYPELSYECIRSRVRRYLEHHVDDIVNEAVIPDESMTDAPVTRSVEYKSDGSAVFDRIISLCASEHLTPDNIMKAHGLDPSLWEVISCKNNLYQQQKAGGEIINLYQSKITVKPIVGKISFDIIRKKFDELDRTYSKPEPVKYPERNAQKHYMYEINLADLHFGKFANMLEVGEQLDTEITRRRFFDVIFSECERIAALGNAVEKILFVWTNDFFNSDGINASTTGGTPQDTSLKWQDLYMQGISMLVEAIDILKQYAPVKTFYIASNHSRQVDYYAICTIGAWFRNDENVRVDIVPSPRHYEQYGVNLIGFAHSYYEKKQNLPYLMSVECPKQWGETKYREYHLAHYHSEQVEEKGGIIFRWLPSITGKDTWTNDCGYIGAVKRSYSFVYDRDRGMIQMNSTIVE